MEIKRFRKKPTFEAVQITAENVEEVADHYYFSMSQEPKPRIFVPLDRGEYGDGADIVNAGTGDWIVRDLLTDELKVVSADEFKERFMEMEEN